MYQLNEFIKPLPIFLYMQDEWELIEEWCYYDGICICNMYDIISILYCMDKRKIKYNKL
jgi:hypothetical protein